jgi:uncharacterized protein (TIGR03435 family)
MWKRISAAMAIAAGLARAQDAAAVFDVASVKVSGPESKRDFGGGPGTTDPGQYHANVATLIDLITNAYRLQYFQVISKAALDRDRFDVTVKVPAGATRDQFRTMMQNLLAERFHLKVHRESRDFPAWEMIVGKSGLKIKESTVAADAQQPEGPPRIGDDGFPALPADKPGSALRFTNVDGFIVGRLAVHRQPISALARQSFGSNNDPPIVDKTGLTGLYDYRLEFSRLSASTPLAEGKVPPVPDLFAAIEQQLGLQLVPKKLPFYVVVVESVDRVPTEN